MGKVPVIRNYDPAGPIMHPDDPRRFDEPCDGNDHSRDAPAEPEKVTAPVTQTPWAAVGLSEEEWNGLEIPAFLRRTAPTLIAPSTPTSTPSTPKSATVPDAAASAGSTSGESTSVPTTAGATGGMFDQFRVDPEEIERKIKAEADALWRNWMPTKTDRKRPRLSTYIKRVRKDYYK